MSYESFLKCTAARTPMGVKYAHQTSRAKVPILSPNAPMSLLNTLSIGIKTQDIKNMPCTISNTFNHLSVLLFGKIVRPKRNVERDIIPYPKRSRLNIQLPSDWNDRAVRISEDAVWCATVVS